MDKGLWVWPSDPKGQRRILSEISGSPHLKAALQGIAKSAEGLSNPEIDELLADNSEWITLWTVRQLLALGFVEYKVDFFGGPAKYVATELGKNALAMITGQPAPVKPPAPVPATPPPTKAS